MDSSIHWNECVEEKRNLLVFPPWQKGMQRAWMDEWLINFARNFLDSRKYVFALLFAWDLFGRIWVIACKFAPEAMSLKQLFLSLGPIIFLCGCARHTVRHCPGAVYVNVSSHWCEHNCQMLPGLQFWDGLRSSSLCKEKTGGNQVPNFPGVPGRWLIDSFL